eukprot:TRINITY_DN25051_c0_g1_i1.p1 TRINITY_DN25051_c0_g1~~TRINITY_DN25051_c0_g1_i1.p1  ORF type:complete len:244 (+),score=12.40 TRINITY_DN25051_c0_g1_i1:22-753(+)
MTIVGSEKLLLAVAGLTSFGSVLLTMWQFAVFLFNPFIHSGGSASASKALYRDILLLCMFVAQHTVLASEPFKKLWQNSNTWHLQRSFYALSTSCALQAVVTFWLPLDRTVWQAPPAIVPWLRLAYIGGWLIVIAQCYTLDFAELVGLKQIWHYGHNYREPNSYYSEPKQRLYRHMRHPVLLGLLAVLWITPVMTLDRFVLALVLTIYQATRNDVDSADAKYAERQFLDSAEGLRPSAAENES